MLPLSGGRIARSATRSSHLARVASSTSRSQTSRRTSIETAGAPTVARSDQVPPSLRETQTIAQRVRVATLMRSIHSCNTRRGLELQSIEMLMPLVTNLRLGIISRTRPSRLKRTNSLD